MARNETLLCSFELKVDYDGQFVTDTKRVDIEQLRAQFSRLAPDYQYIDEVIAAVEWIQNRVLDLEQKVSIKDFTE